MSKSSPQGFPATLKNGGIDYENPHKNIPYPLTETEYERLCKYAEKAGLPKTTYIRHMINGVCPKERPGMDYFKFMKALYQLGNNLNQLTHLAHRFGSLHEAKLEQYGKQFTDMILLITQRMIAPDNLDIPAALERGRLLAESELRNEEGQAHAEQ